MPIRFSGRRVASHQPHINPTMRPRKAKFKASRLQTAGDRRSFDRTFACPSWTPEDSRTLRGITSANPMKHPRLVKTTASGLSPGGRSQGYVAQKYFVINSAIDSTICETRLCGPSRGSWASTSPLVSQTAAATSGAGSVAGIVENTIS